MVQNIYPAVIIVIVNTIVTCFITVTHVTLSQSLFDVMQSVT